MIGVVEVEEYLEMVQGHRILLTRLGIHSLMVELVELRPQPQLVDLVVVVELMEITAVVAVVVDIVEEADKVKMQVQSLLVVVVAHLLYLL
jgi:hypothetical protein